MVQFVFQCVRPTITIGASHRLHTPGRGIKKCAFWAESLEFWWSIWSRFGTFWGVSSPSKSGGFAPRPSPERLVWVLDRFFIFLTLRNLKIFRFQGLNFLFINFLFVRRGVMLEKCFRNTGSFNYPSRRPWQRRQFESVVFVERREIMNSKSLKSHGFFNQHGFATEWQPPKAM